VIGKTRRRWVISNRDGDSARSLASQNVVDGITDHQVAALSGVTFFYGRQNHTWAGFRSMAGVIPLDRRE
ncbi:uncharacterized protein METZ01_LOCUS31830, partial [marine metagenome]